MKKLGIFCAGSLGKEVYDIVERINDAENKWSDVFFVDNYLAQEEFYGKRIYRLEALVEDKNSIEFVIASGEPSTREEIYHQLLREGCNLANVIDPTVIISKTAKIGEGVIIAPFSTISSDVSIDTNVLIQAYIRVGHDIQIGENSVISANVSIGGKTTIGNNVFIGMGAVVKDELTIGNNAILSMGAVLYNDLRESETAIGNPARITKGNSEGKVFR